MGAIKNILIEINGALAIHDYETVLAVVRELENPGEALLGAIEWMTIPEYRAAFLPVDGDSE